MPDKKIISLGGGLQSTTMLLLSLHGQIERADAAIFADTGWERDITYQNINMVCEYAKQFDMPIYVVKIGESVREQLMSGKHTFIPLYTETSNGSKGQRLRQCTERTKIRPIHKKLKDLYGEDVTVEMWLGISLDETLRMKEPTVDFITNRYPLVELKWARSDCAEWLKENNFSIPSKSSCIGCPYHSNETWLSLNDSEREDVIKVDEHIRNLYKGSTRRIKSKPTKPEQLELVDLQEMDARHDDPNYGVFERDMKFYLHQSRRPLKDFFDNPADYPQELFVMENEECEGMCFL